MKLLILLSTLCFSLQSFASPYGFKRGKLELFGEGSFITTSRNYNDDGTLYQLPGTNQLQEINGLLGGSYDFGTNWSLRAETNIRQLNSQSNTVYVYNYTTTGIADLTLGADFLVGEVSRFKFIPDFSVFIPLAGVPGDDLSAFLNDGAILISAKLYVTKDFWILKNAAYGGFNWRAQGYSSQIPFGYMTRGNFNRYFFFDLKAFGEFSMNNDQYSATPSTRNLKIISLNGGSLLYGGVNPSFFSVKAAFGLNIGTSWALSAGIQKSLLGTRAPDELRIFANLKFTGGNGGPASSNKRGAKFQSDDHDQFEVDTE